MYSRFDSAGPEKRYSAAVVYKQHFTRFLKSAPSRLHFAAHSHHFWPDVTRDAVLAYWDDSARLADRKWSYVWTEVVPALRRRVARILDLPDPDQLVFAPNTHEFVNRLISCFETREPIRILTTDSEFHSFRRQVKRLGEVGWVEVAQVPSEPIGTFADRLLAAARAGDFQLIFLSHVFFNSGLAVDGLADLVRALPAEPMLVVDGYHAFCALPTSLRAVADRIFYLAGGYKYAQSGEGVCFMSVPTGCGLRPINTGWFADFGGLEAERSERVLYSDDGMRFAGATFDLSGVYRMNAVLSLLEREGIEIADIHRHVQSLQRRFINHLASARHPLISEDNLLYRAERPHGHFLTFVLPTAAATEELAGQLAAADVTVDYRGSRLRFGFGMYLDAADVDQLFERIAGLSRATPRPSTD